MEVNCYVSWKTWMQNLTLLYWLKCGGVGIYTDNLLDNVIVKDDIKLAISCDCVKHVIESLFIEFCYRGTTESTATRTGYHLTSYLIIFIYHI